MVLTLHGMKPFDNASAQAREWQETADQYGLIIVAPELFNSDLFMQYPLRTITSGVKIDEKNVMAILGYVAKRCHVDKSRIFATSWSSGGYLLHYIVNQYPNMFAGMCARGSCFNSGILSVKNARIMSKRGVPIMIYWGQNDILWIRSESQDAVEWYRKLGFKVRREIIKGRGHERLPDQAAAFFSKHTGIVSRVQQVELDTSGYVGLSPFTIDVSATLPKIPKKQYRDYNFQWSIDNKPQEQATGKAILFATIYTPGEHTIKVKVISPSGFTLHNQIKIRVLPALPKP